MKKKIAIIYFLVLSSILFAQDDNLEPMRRDQVGINATTFISQFFSFNNNFVASNSPYLITYKHIVYGKGLRAGVGVFSSQQSVNPNNGSTSSKTNNMNIDLRLGYESQYSLGKRWWYYIGFDALYGYDLNRTKTSSIGGFPPSTIEIVTDNESFSIGAGPVLGIEFKLGKRISFNAETTAYYAYGERRRRQTNPNFPQFNTNEFTSTAGFDIIIPTSLFFVVHF